MGEKFELFQDGWTDCIKEELNKSELFRQKAKGFTATAVIKMNADEKRNLEEKMAFITIDDGCINEIIIDKSVDDADYIISGDYENWINVLNGDQKAMAKSILKKKLVLEKGSMVKAFKYFGAFEGIKQTIFDYTTFPEM